MTQWVTNPTSIHEDRMGVGPLAPLSGLKDLALLRAVVQVEDAAWIWHGCGYMASRCSSDSTSSLGNSICCGCGPKKEKKETQNLRSCTRLTESEFELWQDLQVMCMLSKV